MFRLKMSEESPIEFIEISKGELRVRLLSWGATLVSVWFPDKQGRVHDLILGYDSIEAYKKDTVQMGKTIGRVANRIKLGQIELSEELIHQVELNDGKNHIHGGTNGCSQRNWTIETRTPESVTFSIKQTHDLDQYPGDASLTCTYTVTDENQLVIEHTGETTELSPIALTNHSYWRLNEDAETCHDLRLFIHASYYLPVDADNCPNGEVRTVFGTSFNFTNMRRVGPPLSIRQDAMRFDNDLIFDAHDSEDAVLVMENPHTGIRLSMVTTYPSVHIYSSNQFDGSLIGKGGRALPEFAALAIEPQMYSSAAHFSFFPSVLIEPPEEYNNKIIYTFERAH